ncbi:hypothetical protein ID866_2514 [Astraeus odoratus]|nr:hypothetical protein ID866_2514 [Astraeus odoratus]
MFSTPYYSSLSLLPADPAPFTVPSASTRRSRQQNVSLNNYPLPDGTWRWVSKAWMIDMRANLGEVQHDGFEYNWSFREKHWHAEVGPLSAGAWVRRRRWVRLMMRPAKCTSDRSGSSTNSPAQTTRTSPLTSTSSILLANSASDIALDSLEREAYRVWQGDPDEHWHRCRRLLVRLGSDGRKLELWRLWLAPHIHDGSEDPKGKGKQSNNDHSPPEAHTRCPPPLPTLSMLLRNHVSVLLCRFCDIMS